MKANYTFAFYAGHSRELAGMINDCMENDVTVAGMPCRIVGVHSINLVGAGRAVVVFVTEPRE